MRCFCGPVFLALCVYFSTGCSGEGVEQKTARDRAAQVQQEIQTLKRLDTPQLEHDAQTQLKRLDMPKKKFATGRFENHIIIDTNGCSTFEEFDRLSTGDQAVSGCIDLDRGDRVIGPLEVKAASHGGTEFNYARVQVPRKDERWTFLNHLQDLK